MSADPDHYFMAVTDVSANFADESGSTKMAY